MSPRTCLRMFLMLGLVLIPSIQASPFDEEDFGHDDHEIRDLLEMLDTEERAIGYKDSITALNQQLTGYFADDDVDGIASMFDRNVIQIRNGNYLLPRGLTAFKERLNEMVGKVDIMTIKTQSIYKLDKYARFVYEKRRYKFFKSGVNNAFESGTSVIVWRDTKAGFKVYIQMDVVKD